MHHMLKTWPIYFQAVRAGEKTFELRLNDRGFAVGDRLNLREWNPIDRTYTGDCVIVDVTYVIDLKDFADIKGRNWAIARKLMPNIAILSIRKVPEENP
jgi:ASC-1-like (ASCH) protein